MNCKYFKKGSDNKSVLKNLVEYIATRDVVEKVTIKEENQNLPPTQKQIDLIKNLESEFDINYGVQKITGSFAMARQLFSCLFFLLKKFNLSNPAVFFAVCYPDCKSPTP